MNLIKTCFGDKMANSGFIALVSILIISAVAGLVVIGVSERSSDELKIIQADEVSWIAYYLAHACVEEALRKIRLSGNDTSATNLSYASGTCSATTVRAGLDYTIVSQSTVSGFVKSFVVAARRATNGRITINSWTDQ